jgi:hypothetical protein
MPPRTYSDFFSPASTAHNQIDQLIGELGDPGSIRAADPWWNMYGQAKESVGDWLGEMLPPSPGIEPGTPRYESAEENIRSFFNLLPEEKWELPLYAVGGGSFITNPKKVTKLIRKVSEDSDKLMVQYKKAKRDLTTFRRKYQPKDEFIKTSGSTSRSDEILGPIFNSNTKKYELLDNSTMYKHEFGTERLATLTKEALYSGRKYLTATQKEQLKKLVAKEDSFYEKLKENELIIDELVQGRHTMPQTIQSVDIEKFKK